MDGFETSLVVAAVIALAGAVIALVFVRPHEREDDTARDTAVDELAA
jgi:hypothetical protein